QEFPQTSRFILPMILFVISLLFLFLPSFLSGIFSVEVAPSFSSSFQVAQQSISDSSLMFGSGPGTYAIDYAKFAPADINASNFWDVRFDRAGSHLLTILASWGIVGALLLVLFLVSLFALSIKELVSKREHDEWKMTFVAFSGWLVLAFSMFVYSSNFTLTFMFWFLSAVLASQIGPTIRQWEFSKNPRFGLMTAFLFVVVNVVLLTMVFMSVSRYAAEVSFAKAVQSDRTNAPIDSIIKELDTAARLNKLSDVYYRNLGNALLVKAGEMLEDPEMDTSTLKEVIGLSINAAKRSTEISPSNVVNWHLLGDVYREVSPIVANADLFSISAYQNATLLAPNNPKYRTALARAYLVRAESLATLLGSEDEVVVAEADTKMQEAYSLAVLELEKAISLKSDYAAAHYYLSIAYERQGNLGEAISKMEAVRSVAYNDIGVALQLGLLYLRQGKTTEARIELERAVSIAPNFSNAMWYLSYVYEQEGDLQKAIEQIEKIRELNPENPLIDQRLSDLQNGFVAQTLPEPLEEDSENIVEEIQEVIAE
ncbi:tetratricopeptide repeat protein, partial [Patescibacteria group bacterium]|nr:tetratricopeptide repeat protein [Patescibacteria group bacterium]